MRILILFVILNQIGCGLVDSSINSNAQLESKTSLLSKVKPGNGFICALFKNGQIKCWGNGGLGGLGTGLSSNYGDSPDEQVSSQSYVNLGTQRTAKDLSLNQFHACALLDDSSVKCWGANNYNQLGLGNGTINIGVSPSQMGDNLPPVNLGTGRTAKAISAGAYHTCVILDNDSIKCWGSNTYGELGIGASDATRGSVSAGMGDALPSVDLGVGRTAKYVSAGYFTTCAILDNDELKCWGYNASGQLGYGDTSHRGKTPGSLGAGLPAISLGTGLTAKSVMAAVNYTCALLSNNSVKCWGQNTYGQLGLGDTTNRGVAANQMGDFLPSVDFGSGSAYPLSLGGLTHSCVLMSDSKVKCWGYNLYANLGIGNTTHWGTTSSQLGTGFSATGLGSDFTPESIYVGGHNTCAVSALGKVKCWGTNVFGQLGRGDTNAQGDDSNEMDDNLPLLDMGT